LVPGSNVSHADADAAQPDSATRAKRSFLANISHEIRTPMNAIIGFAHLMRRDPLSPRQQDHLDRIEQAGQHLLQLINDILDFARIEAHQTVLQPSNVRLHDSMRAVVASVADEAATKGLRLQLDLDQAPVWLHVDRARLEQVLGHLVGNAVKFTCQGHVLLRVLTLPDAGLRFEVHDSGPGVPESRQPHLFEAFEQADVSTTRRFGGTGLGLAICHRLVSLMQGRIGLSSQLGAGSLFWFELPVGERAVPPLPLAGASTALEPMVEPMPHAIPPGHSGVGGLAALAAAQAPAGQAAEAPRALDTTPPEQALPVPLAGGGAADDPELDDVQQTRLGCLPGLKLKQGLAHVGGDWPLYRHALGLFVRHHGQDTWRLTQLAEQGDVAGLRQLAHALAGAASTLAAQPLAQRAHALEHALSADASARPAESLQGAGPVAPLPLAQLAQPVVQALLPLLAGLRQILRLPDGPAQPPEPTAPAWSSRSDMGAAPAAVGSGAAAVADAANLRRLLLQLQPLLRSHDTSALEVLAQVQPQLRAALGPLADTLAEQVQNFSFEEARRSLGLVLKQLP
jgi:HPt (histidine-containing phosphotransfer) domain-containing protein